MTGSAAKAPLPTSFYALWHTEKRLLDLYDEALAITPVHTPGSRLLAAQKAETAQACQVIVDAIRNWYFIPVPAPGPVHCSA
ncbi:MAG: hypothetical protein WAU13_14695 [Albidovulum sp.]